VSSNFLFQVAGHNSQLGLVSGLENYIPPAEVRILLIEATVCRIGHSLVMVEVCSSLVKGEVSVRSLKNLH
jgi:hypothetical protein